MFGVNNLQYKMNPSLTVTEESRQENHVELKVNIVENANQLFCTDNISSINSAVSIHIRVLYTKRNNTTAQTVSFGSTIPQQSCVTQMYVLFKFSKKSVTDHSVYSIICTSVELKLADKEFFTDNDTFYLVNEVNSTTFTFNIALTAKVVNKGNPFKALYDDNELVDFKLVGENGSIVKVHGAVLAAQSPTVMKMVKDKTITAGLLECNDMQEEILQHFKEYLYLSVLPKDNLNQLLLLAMKFEMKDLEQKCIENIMNNLTPSNTYSWIEFAQKNNIFNLFFGILDYIQAGKIKVSDIKKSLKAM
ncbi:uncharacterized protein [Battus philenor]|uniref:uncharacterized protein n=1 Tax=Battus philenor TaxID=42288 RepID=UPI0035D0FECD